MSKDDEHYSTITIHLNMTFMICYILNHSDNGDYAVVGNLRDIDVWRLILDQRKNVCFSHS